MSSDPKNDTTKNQSSSDTNQLSSSNAVSTGDHAILEEEASPVIVANEAEIIQTLQELGNEYDDLCEKEMKLITILQRLQNEQRSLQSAISEISVTSATILTSAAGNQRQPAVPSPAVAATTTTTNTITAINNDNRKRKQPPHPPKASQHQSQRRPLSTTSQKKKVGLQRLEEALMQGLGENDDDSSTSSEKH